MRRVTRTRNTCRVCGRPCAAVGEAGGRPADYCRAQCRRTWYAAVQRWLRHEFGSLARRPCDPALVNCPRCHGAPAGAALA